MNGTSCCFGFKWDLTQKKCISCGKGYMGPNCETKCPYPSYGEVCQMSCNCIDKNCDPVNGCNQWLSTEYPTTHSKDFDYKIITTRLLESKVSISENFPDNTPRNDGTTRCKTSNQEREKINSLIFALIGLLIVAFIIVFAYVYMRLLEKRFKVTRIV